MEKLFRIKKEALPFIAPKHATAVYKMSTWENAGVFEGALEEVEKIHIIHGIKKSNNSSDLSGWADQKTQIHFTIEIRGESCQDADKTVRNMPVRELMNEFQEILNKRYNA